MVEDFLKDAERIDLKNMGRGKYFRIVADVYADGESLTEVLIDAGMAVRYNGGKKIPVGVNNGSTDNCF